MVAPGVGYGMGRVAQAMAEDQGIEFAFSIYQKRGSGYWLAIHRKTMLSLAKVWSNCAASSNSLALQS